MKKTTFLFATLFGAVQLFATDYYVDASSGNDANDGKTPATAWKSLSKSTTNKAFLFGAGDKLYIKAGTTYQNQQLVIEEASGTPENPFVVTSYGEGAKPIINFGTLAGDAARDTKKATLYLYNSAGVEVSNLEINNYTGRPTQASAVQKYGAYIFAQNKGEVKHIKISHIDFKDVKGNVAQGDDKSGAGVFYFCDGKGGATWYNGLEIGNCTFDNIDRVGITGNNNAGRVLGWFNNINVHIHRNTLTNIGGQGITVKGCDGAVCEYNRVDRCGQRDRGVGIWSYKTDNTVFQYNVVTHAEGGSDAQGFDSDWNCMNTIFQYNVSAHNEGGFMLVCLDGSGAPYGDDKATWNAGTKGTTIRYNLSVNDGHRERASENKAYFSPTFHITGPVRHTQIYGNTLIMNKKTNDKIDRNFLASGNWGSRVAQDVLFYNNIFYAGEGMTAGFDSYANVPNTDMSKGKMNKTKGQVFSNNIYVGSMVNIPTSSDDLFVGKVGVSDETIIKYDAAGIKLGLDAPLFKEASMMDNFDLTGLTHEQIWEKAEAFQLVSSSEALANGKNKFLVDFYAAIQGIQIDYYTGTGFTGYEPPYATDYLSNNFGEMGGKMIDFFGNTVDDQQAMSIGFHQPAEGSGLPIMSYKEIQLFPTYTSSYVTVPSLEGTAYVVTPAGSVVYATQGNGEDVQINVSSYSNGIYFVRTSNGTGKFIKE